MSMSLSWAAKKRLLVVEDDECLCNFLGKSLSHYGYEPELLLSGEGIPRKMERDHFNLIVLDIQLPGKDGFYWMKWFRNYYPYVPIIIISAKREPEDRLEGLKAGACDYVIKPFHDEELLIKIRSALNGGIQKTETQLNVIEIGDFTLDTVNGLIIKGAETLPVTQLECKILQLLYMNTGTPMNREDLMWQTMGVRYVPSNRSIDTHINRLRKKIETIPAKPAYIRTVRGRGYCFYLPQ